MLLEPAKAAVLVFVASILQVTIFSGVEILGGTPDVVLLTLPVYALTRRLLALASQPEGVTEVRLLG